MSVRELAETTGEPAQSIQALEAGELDADLETLLVLSDGLGVQVSAFFVRAERIGKGAEDED